MPKFSIRLIVLCLIVILLSTLTQNIFAAQNKNTLKQTQEKKIEKIKAKIKPTETPKPTNILTPTETPTPILISKTDHILSEINDFRRSKGLTSLAKDSYSCQFASMRVNEVVSSFTHDGFQNRINDKTLPYPTYTTVTENIAMTTEYKDVVSLWINSPGHADNMSKDTPFGCVASIGNYYVFESWKP